MCDRSYNTPKKENITRSWDEYGLSPGATNYITTPKNIITLTGMRQWVIAQSTHLKFELERRNAWLSYELYIYVRCVFLLFYIITNIQCGLAKLNADVSWMSFRRWWKSPGWMMSRSLDPLFFWVVWRFLKKWKPCPDMKDTGWLWWNSTFIVTVRNAILGLNFRWGTNVFKRNQCYLGRWINYTHPFP